MHLSFVFVTLLLLLLSIQISFSHSAPRPLPFSSLSPSFAALSSSFSSSSTDPDSKYIFLHSGTINTNNEKDILKMKERDLEGVVQFLVHVEEINSSYTKVFSAQLEQWGGKIMYLLH